MKNRKKKLRELREKKAQGIRSLKWAILWIITMLAIVAFVGYKNGWFGKKHYDINKELENTQLLRQIDQKKPEREAFVDDIVKDVAKHIADAGIKAQINGRVKHFFSIYKKMVKIEAPVDDTSDTTASVPTATDEFKDSIR